MRARLALRRFVALQCAASLTTMLAAACASAAGKDGTDASAGRMDSTSPTATATPPSDAVPAIPAGELPDANVRDLMTSCDEGDRAALEVDWDAGADAGVCPGGDMACSVGDFDPACGTPGSCGLYVSPLEHWFCGSRPLCNMTLRSRAPVGCVQLHQPGECDPACAPLPVTITTYGVGSSSSQSETMLGCRRSDGSCGWLLEPLGCLDTRLFQSEDVGVYLGPSGQNLYPQIACAALLGIDGPDASP
jgi:hypothetical protein